MPQLENNLISFVEVEHDQITRLKLKASYTSSGDANLRGKHSFNTFKKTTAPDTSILKAAQLNEKHKRKKEIRFHTP